MWRIRPVTAVARSDIDHELGRSSAELESGDLAIQQSYQCLRPPGVFSYATFDVGTQTVTALGWTSTLKVFFFSLSPPSSS